VDACRLHFLTKNAVTKIHKVKREELARLSSPPGRLREPNEKQKASRNREATHEEWQGKMLDVRACGVIENERVIN